MVRRVGFGDGGRRARARREEEAPPVSYEPQVEAADSGPEPVTRKKASLAARVFIIAFLLVWLTLWSYGIITAWEAATEIWANFDWKAMDIAMLAFFAIWLGGALLGWAFGVVILFLMLFGKEVDRSPAEQAERWKRRMARMRRKDDA